MKRYRLLILTASTGGGHNARADALAAWAREFYGEEVEVKIYKPLEEGRSPLGSFGVELYNFIQRHMPFLHNIYFPIIEKIWDFQGDTFFGRGAYEKILESFRPQMIVSLHDLFNKSYFRMAHQKFGTDVRCALYCGEYADGKGFSKHAVSLEVDRWIGRTQECLCAAERCGMPAERMEQFTFFLPPGEIGRESSLTRKAIGLSDDKLTILMASGQNGALESLKFLKALLPYRDHVQAIVVCGLNEKMRREVAQWQWETGFPALIEGYSSHMSDYMRLSDVMFFKGGANTATRAFYEACPMWFDASEGIMPQEELTVDFFLQAGAGAVILSPSDLVQWVKEYSQSSEKIDEMRQSMIALREKHLTPPAREFFEEFLAWGFEVEQKEQLAPSQAFA